MKEESPAFRHGECQRSSSRNVIFGLTPAPHLRLTPGSTSHHLEVLVQSTQFVLFLERQFLAIVPFSPAFPTSTTFAFFSYSPEGALAADVVFSNLAIYPSS